MIFIKYFIDVQERQSCTDTYKYMSYTEEDKVVNIHQEHDYSQDYLTFIAKSSGTFNFSGSSTANTISYSTDNGATWSEAAQNVTVNVNNGDSVLWKGELTPNTTNGSGTFSTSTASFAAQGNTMSLLFGDNYNNQTSLSGKDYVFKNLFCGSKVVNAENMIMQATTLTTGCYTSMFEGCTSLTTAPELPATTLALSCYRTMFLDCTSLTTAPELPATTLAQDCYHTMFGRCTSLTTAPELPATTLALSCYSQMFQGCTSLTTASELKATTLTTGCYTSMFQGCTSLTTASELKATTLANICYESMFKGCTSLTTAPELKATMLTTGCYTSMFEGCISLTTAPELPATTLTQNCYQKMFNGCTNLNYIKAMFITAPNTSTRYSYTNYWVQNVAAEGTFIKNSAATWTTTGVHGVPSGWTVETASR